jgi:hypothetical protein
MKCYSLTLGVRNLTGARWRYRDEEVVKQITQRHFPDGFTILRAAGGWFDPARRRFVRESSRQVLVSTTDVKRLRPWCRDLAMALHQKELLLIELGPARVYRFDRHPVRQLSHTKREEGRENLTPVARISGAAADAPRPGKPGKT